MTAKKKTRKKATKKILTPTDLKPADYNPREFDDKALSGLKKSMSEFVDISGITFNSKTKNIVTGHHRWENICETHGLDNLVFKPIEGTDKSLIFTKEDIDTGYILRVVNWTMKKEKAANVTANSHAIEGKFTDGLQTILSELRSDLDEETFTELRLDNLELNIKPEKDSEPPTKKDKKSETVISGGGESYKTLHLELTPKLAKRFEKQLNRFKASESVEKNLEVIVNYLESKEDDEILWVTQSKKVVKKATKKASKKARRRSA